MNSFDVRLALSFADNIDAMYRGALKPTINNAETDTQVFIGGHEGRFTILFPGTASARDVRTDLKFRKTEWMTDPDCFVHRGAAEAWRSVLHDVLRQTEGAKSAIIGGHSLGGMLATLGADFLSAAGVEICGVYTFGCPRVGNENFAARYNAKLGDRTFRIWNAGDPVPALPPRLPIPRTGTYTHVDGEIYLTDGNIIVEPHPIRHWLEVISALRSPLSLINALAAPDHPITSYITKLEALA